MNKKIKITEISRYTVPLDDKIHIITLSGNPGPTIEYYYDNKSLSLENYLSFWAPWEIGGQSQKRKFRVYSTGYPIEGDTIFWGTTPRVNGLIFHLIEHLDD